jgi:hypothetical protein
MSCCSGREHVHLLLELVLESRYDKDIAALLPGIRYLMFRYRLRDAVEDPNAGKALGT